MFLLTHGCGVRIKELVSIRKLAKPSSFSKTSSPSTLITVHDANVRCATVSGTFLVVGGVASTYLYRGKRVVDVACSWYQWQPNRGCIRLILRNGEVPFVSQSINEDYVTNIER